ncbi:MAG TPA: sigma-54 dependent transcriptional regulator [Vicinamibacterales bacterium]|jgi:DNA-binding NtrC family response regulator
MALILSSLAHQVRGGGEPFLLRPRLELALRDLLKAQSVRLRDRPSGGDGTPPSPPGAVRLDVPTRQGQPTVVMEVALAAEPRLDEWGYQLLRLACDVAALVVEIDWRLTEVSTKTAPTTRRAAPAVSQLVGTSEVMCTLREHIARVAATDFTVLIQGESGTGKELVARLIHDSSWRRHGPFVAVNCAAIVESLLEAELFGIEDRTATGVRGRRGKFEHADGGTLFLDEVSDLAPAAQAKLLRAIQELTVERVGGHCSRKVDARIVVATNRSLRELAARGAFREDLYYRLSGVELHVPPLRDRREDIAALSEHFLSRYQTPRPLTLTTSAAEALAIYDWHGNVRELERVIEGAVALARSEWITIDDLPPALRGDCAEILLPSLMRDDTMRAWATRYAQLVLERCGQNKRHACRILGISYHTLQAYLRRRPHEGTGVDALTAWQAPPTPADPRPAAAELIVTGG